MYEFSEELILPDQKLNLFFIPDSNACLYPAKQYKQIPKFTHK